MYGSCRTSTLDIPQSLRKPDAEMSQSILSLSENSESQRMTTNMVVQVWSRPATQDPKADDVEHSIQANVTPLETNDQVSPARQGLVQPAGAEGYSEANGVDLGIHSIMPPRTAEDGPSSTPLDLNQSAVTPATQDATVPVRVYHEEGLSETDKLYGEQKLPRKKKEDEGLDAEVTVEVEAQSGYIDQQRLPRKKRGSEELEVASLPLRDQERLPRKKESEESDGGRSG